MRVTRAKFYRKYLRFYRIVYNIVAPYNVLIDGNFVFAAIKNKGKGGLMDGWMDGWMVCLYILHPSSPRIHARGPVSLQRPSD